MPRKPVVDGQFYPAEPGRLRAAIESYTPKVEQKERALGLLSPHAGYPFSGPVAGKTFARVAVPRAVVLLNPSHWSRPASVCALDGGRLGDAARPGCAS